MAIGLSIYRGLAETLGLLYAPLASVVAPARSAWREAATGASEEAVRAAGSVWVHAASLGEVGAAGTWVRALAASGLRPPFLLTTRTRAGRDRAARELGPLVTARVAPLDAPRLVGALVDTACPARLDVIETEIWPNLVVETRRRNIPVAFVSATVSERTARRLRALRVAGPALFGRGVFVLAQREEDATRFASLGVPEPRIRVTGDLKADAALTAPSEDAGAPPASRRAVVFGSARPGEEEIALRIAAVLEGLPGSPLLVVAPRHDEGVASFRARLAASGYAVIERDEAARAATPVARWIEDAAATVGRRVALLATRGELPDAYGRARVAVVGGTFAPHGGHNPIEPAARGAAIVVGPRHEGIAAALIPLRRAGACETAADPGEAAAAVLRLWAPDGLDARSAAARRAAAEGGGVTGRSLEALAAWGIVP
ncbi:MAG: 3-deoxy-D-manno-octulosonic acid transferase [Hyphomicrobiales bacterium]